MKTTPLLFVIIISVLLSDCSQEVSINNGNKYFLESVSFQLEENGDWGFADFNGQVLIEPRYENRPTSFKNGFAIIKDDTVYYYIDTAGDTIGSHYYFANLFNNNRALIKDKKGELFFINENGEIAFNVDTIAKDELQSCSNFNCELALFRTSDKKHGYFNPEGEIVIDPKYSKAEDFSEDIAYVELTNEEDNSVEKMLINTEDNIIKKFDESLEWMLKFNEGKAAFKDSSGCGYIDIQGELAINPRKEWEDLTSFINGYAAYKYGGDWGVIDSTGAKVLSSVYERPPFFYNGLAIIKENDMYGVIDLIGNKIIEPAYDHIAFPCFNNKFLAKDGKYYLVLDTEGVQLNEEEYYRIDLLSAFQYSLTTGYMLVGERVGISINRLETTSIDMEEFLKELRDEYSKLFYN